MNDKEFIKKMILIHEVMKGKYAGETPDGRPTMHVNDVSSVMREVRETLEEYREANNV